MDTPVLKTLKRQLAYFLRRFYVGIKTGPSRQHFRTYIQGQLGNLERKTAAAIALEAGVAPRSLQEFLEIHRWDHHRVRTRLQEVVTQAYAHPQAIGQIDETSYAKKGDQTCGVQRQYCGATGKKDNCVVSVHLGYVADAFHTLVDSDVYLPEETWAHDADRCQAAGIPDEVSYRPKWQIGLDLLARSWAQGVRLAYLCADEIYGRCHHFRQGVAEYGIIYGVEVPCSLKGWTQSPPLQTPSTHASSTGRPRTQTRLAPGAPTPRRVDRLWQRGGPSWEAFHVKETQKGPVVWEIRSTRFFPWEEGLPGPEQWLLIARQVLTGEHKYFLCNAPSDTPVEQMIHVIFSRWHIERIFDEAKGQVGLDHFEVRHYQPLIRHLILSMVSLFFLMQESDQIQEKKIYLERASRSPGTRCAA